MTWALLDDLRTAVRTLRRRPRYTGAVILTLALALGANTAIFTLVHAILLRQLPLAGADRLVAIHAVAPDSDRQPFSIPDYLDLGASGSGLEGLAGWSGGSANLTATEAPIRLQAQWTTPGFFEVVGARAALGRLPLAEEERGRDRVVLLADSLWRSRFGGDPAVIGRTLTLNGEPYVVVGVLPPEFVFFTAGADLAAPLDLDRDRRRAARGSAFLRLVGRLAPGTNATAATAELDATVARLRAAYPDTNANRLGVRLSPLRDLLVGGHRQMLLVLQAAVALVLLIACANLASFLYTRMSGRQHELAVRATLGARRRDLLRQLLVENLVLALAGGMLGLLLAAGGVRLLLAAGPADLPRAREVGLDLQVVGFNLGLSLVAGLVFGVLPALQGSGRRLAQGLRTSGRGGTPGRRRRRLGAALVAVEVGLSLALLVGAGLLVRSFVRLQDTHPGFRADHLLMIQLALPPSRYGTPAAIARYADELRDRLAALPGATDAGVASLTPLTNWKASVNFTIDGRADPTREQAPLANYRAVSPGYFRAMGIPVRAGRDLAAADGAEATPVAVISETLARRHFAAGGALGQRLVIDDVAELRAVEIVGVVGDLKHTGLDAEGSADLFVPYAQTPARVSVWLANILCAAVRTQGDPHALVPAVRRELQALDREVAVASMRTMEEAYAASLASRRFNTRLLELFGAAALALAIAGVYALTAFAVAERNREIGVRMALGADRPQILRLMVGGAMAPVGAGILVGGAAALAGSRLLSNLLFGIGAADPFSFAVAAATLGLASLLASAIPARRALRVEPVRALRAE